MADMVVTHSKHKICGNDEIVSIEIYHYTYVGILHNIIIIRFYRAHILLLLL